MKIELSDGGFDSTLIMINNALHGALETKDLRLKDKLINRALGAVIALKNLTLVWDDTPENNSESNNIIDE
jgi:hypothetical protein